MWRGRSPEAGHTCVDQAQGRQALVLLPSGVHAPKMTLHSRFLLWYTIGGLFSLQRVRDHCACRVYIHRTDPSRQRLDTPPTVTYLDRLHPPETYVALLGVGLSSPGPFLSW